MTVRLLLQSSENKKCGFQQFFPKKVLAQFKSCVILYTILNFGAVAQLARASHWQCEGRGFESLFLHQTSTSRQFY